MRFLELFQDEGGRYSLARVLPAATFATILAQQVTALLQTGHWVDVPPGWIQVLGTTLGGYAVRAAVPALAGAIATRPPAQTTINHLPPQAPPRGPSGTPDPHPQAGAEGEGAGD